MNKKEYLDGARDWLWYFLITAVLTIIFVVLHSYTGAVLAGLVCLMCGIEALNYWSSAQEADDVIKKNAKKEIKEASVEKPPVPPHSPGADNHFNPEEGEFHGS